MIRLCAPVVTNTDRAWSEGQRPAWAPPGFPPEGERQKVLHWGWFVADQAERFERYFAHERKAAGDWSRLWRAAWWPKADPLKLYPRLVPKSAPDRRPHPFWKAGTPGFEAVLALATPRERWLWRRIGVAQLAPDDPRAKALTERQAA